MLGGRSWRRLKRPPEIADYSNFEHPKGWNRDIVRSFLENEFKKDPAIRIIVRRNPPFFTSNHAAFSLLFPL